MHGWLPGLDWHESGRSFNHVFANSRTALRDVHRSLLGEHSPASCRRSGETRINSTICTLSSSTNNCESRSRRTLTVADCDSCTSTIEAFTSELDTTSSRCIHKAKLTRPNWTVWALTRPSSPGPHSCRFYPTSSVGLRRQLREGRAVIRKAATPARDRAAGLVLGHEPLSTFIEDTPRPRNSRHGESDTATCMQAYEGLTDTIRAYHEAACAINRVAEGTYNSGRSSQCRHACPSSLR